MSKLAIYPGSLDPVTNGHVNLISGQFRFLTNWWSRWYKLKEGCFSMEERIELLKAVTSDIPGVRVELFQGLWLIMPRGLFNVVRGLRAMSDLSLNSKWLI